MNNKPYREQVITVEWFTLEQKFPNDLDFIIIEDKAGNILLGEYFQEGFVFVDIGEESIRVKLEDVVCWTYDPVVQVYKDFLSKS